MSTVNSNIKIGKKNAAFFAANPALLLLDGQLIYNETTGDLFIGDGVTPLIGLTPINAGFTPSGTNLDYIAGDGSYITFPTDNAAFTNGAGYLSSGDINVTVQAYSANTTLLGNSTTGSGSIVLGTQPTFTQWITVPRIYGGTAAGDGIDYYSTSGNGTGSSIAHRWLGGNNGATTLLTILNDGTIRIPNNRVIQGVDSAGINRSLITWSSGDNITINGRPGSTDVVINPTNGGLGMYIKGASGDGSIGVASPSARWHIVKTTEQLRIGYDTSNYISETVSSLGNITYNNVTSTQTSGINLPNYRWNGITKTWAAGTITNQYWNYFTANTAAFASASTITNSYGLYVEAATAGTNATITNNYALGTSGYARFNVGSVTGGIQIRDHVGTNTTGAIYMGVATPSANNYILWGTAGSTVLNGTASTSTLDLRLGNVMRARFDNTAFQFVTGNATTGVNTDFTYNCGTHTGQTASTNIPNFRVNGSTKTWAAGTLATQYFNYFTANTVAFASASTATMPVNLYVEAPLAGANCTATNLAAIGCGGHLFIANSVGVPANNPTGGGLLYVEAGALKYRGSSGTVTTIANA